jgi:hypothetical protein
VRGVVDSSFYFIGESQSNTESCWFAPGGITMETIAGRVELAALDDDHLSHQLAPVSAAFGDDVFGANASV